MQSVFETTRRSIYPPTIAKKRGNFSTWGMLFFSITLYIVGICFLRKNTWFYIGSLTGVSLLTIFLIEVIKRICLVMEEYRHLISRYERNMTKLILDTFSFSFLSCVMISLGFFLVFMVFVSNTISLCDILQENIEAFMIIFVSVSLLGKLFKIEQSPLNDKLKIHELKGLDYGSGMARSFFYGYLRIVLPHSGTSEKGIKEFLKDYEGRNNIKFDLYKLFILIPLSQYCPPSLENNFSKSIETSKELEAIEINRAGVRNRSYKNAVYKINTINGIKRYVAAEYATPVKTFAESMSHNEHYKHYAKEILLNFYLTLRKLISEDPDCASVCEIIFYDDKDEDGEYIDVGYILLNRMKQLMKKKN